VEFRNCTGLIYNFNAPSIPTDVAGCQGKISTSCCNNWIVVMQRVDGTLDFNKKWDEYKNGFGDPKGNFYMGNEDFHCLTKEGKYRIRFEGKLAVSGQWFVGTYPLVAIASEEEGYRLSIMDDEGTPGHMAIEDNMQFTTIDRDNDLSDVNCAKINGGGWWFKACYDVCLTCEYKTHFEIKDLGANSHLSAMRVSILRSASADDESDTYGAGPTVDIVEEGPPDEEPVSSDDTPDDSQPTRYQPRPDTPQHPSGPVVPVVPPKYPKSP